MRGRRAQLEVVSGSDPWEAKRGPRPCGGAVSVSTSIPVATWGSEKRPPPMRGRRPLAHLKGERQRTRGARGRGRGPPSGGLSLPKHPRVSHVIPLGVSCSPRPPALWACCPAVVKRVQQLGGGEVPVTRPASPAGCRACHSFGSLGVFSLGVPAPGVGACLPSQGFMRGIYGCNLAPILGFEFSRPVYIEPQFLKILDGSRIERGILQIPFWNELV